MKMRSVGLLSLILSVCLSSVMVAQDEGQGRGQGRGRGGPGGGPGGGGRGFGGGFGMGMGMGSAMELLGLLRMEEVQKEVGMSPETYQTVQAAMPDMRSLFQAEESERAAKMKEANTKAQEMIDEALSPEQQKRLLGLLVQQNGMRAVANDMVAKELGLDAAKTDEIKAILTKSGEAMREKMQEAFGSGDREKIREMMDEARKESEQAVAATLSDDQKKALEALKGAPFTFPERRGFGGPGGGGAGGGGRGPGGNRNNN